MNIDRLDKSPNDSTPSVLNITVTDNSNNQNYTLTFSCLLNNIHNEVEDNQDLGNIIYYSN